MSQKNPDIQMALYRARLLLEEGRNDDALQELRNVETQIERLESGAESQRDDLAYLLGWCYIQLKRWDEAVSALAPLRDASQSDGAQEPQAERERLAIYLLRLGEAATRLSHYEDASLHFTLCLKVLHNRRIHLPPVRIKACYSLATTCVQRGLYIPAIQYYEEALRLCRHYNEESELPAIYYGLCDARRHMRDLDKAYAAGEQALQLYEQTSDRKMAATTHNLLGSIAYLQGSYRQASDHYTASLAISSRYNGPTMAMVNCAALAEVRLAEERLDEAKKYCELAREYISDSDNAQMCGIAYHVIGKVRIAEAQEASGQQRRALLEDAVTLFERAKEHLLTTQAYTDMAEVYGSLAKALEALGREQDAILIWRQAYDALEHTQTPS